MATPKAGDNSFGHYAGRINHLLDEQDELKESVKEVYAEAKAAGLTPKTMRRAISTARKAAKDRTKWEKEEEEYDIFLHALLGPAP